MDAEERSAVEPLAGPRRGLSTVERVVAGSGLAFLLSALLVWFDAVPRDTAIRERYPVVASLRGIEVGLLWGPLPMLLALVVVVGVLVRRVSPSTIPPSWRPTVVLRSLAFTVFALVLLEVILGEPSGSFDSLVSVDVHRAFGLYLASAAALVLAVGASRLDD